jgi:putative copper export protein
MQSVSGNRPSSAATYGDHRLAVGRLPRVSDTYGQALMVKIGLFIIMVAIATFNRFGLMRQLSSAVAHGPILRQLRWMVILEQGFGLAALLAASVLGMTNPRI